MVTVPDPTEPSRDAYPEKFLFHRGQNKHNHNIPTRKSHNTKEGMCPEWPLEKFPEDLVTYVKTAWLHRQHSLALSCLLGLS